MPLAQDGHIIQTLAARGPISFLTLGFFQGLNRLDRTSLAQRKIHVDVRRDLNRLVVHERRLIQRLTH